MAAESAFCRKRLRWDPSGDVHTLALRQRPRRPTSATTELPYEARPRGSHDQLGAALFYFIFFRNVTKHSDTPVLGPMSQ